MRISRAADRESLDLSRAYVAVGDSSAAAISTTAKTSLDCNVCNREVKHHSHRLSLSLSFLILSSQAEIKKYSTYYVNVDPDQDDKATEIKLLSFKRPHMRAFHCSWMGFFTVRQRLSWSIHHLGIGTSLPPLLRLGLFHMVCHRAAPARDQKYPWADQAAGLDVKYLLGCRDDLHVSSLFMVHSLSESLTSPISFTPMYRRFINGPMCDKYGARILMGVLLMAASIPCACTGLVNSSVQLSILRFFIGLGGSTFVCCQFWTSRMFTKEVAGTANALVGGWGNLGGGV